jgi:hypothetical protein
MQIRSQQLVLIRARAVINNGDYRDSDIFFNCLEKSFTDQSGAAKDWIDMDEQGYIWIMFEQAKDLQMILSGFTLMTKQ